MGLYRMWWGDFGRVVEVVVWFFSDVEVIKFFRGECVEFVGFLGMLLSIYIFYIM